MKLPCITLKRTAHAGIILDVCMLHVLCSLQIYGYAMMGSVVVLDEESQHPGS